MRVLQINATYKIGSTGKIVAGLSDIMANEGIENYVLCAYSNEINDNLYIMSKCRYPNNARLNILRMMITGLNGYFRKSDTQKDLEWIDSIKPDVIHIHNIHGDWINISLVFNYIKKRNLPVIWTFHDCWPFTGRCSYFDMCGCEKWKTQCQKCLNKSTYPTTLLFDFSKKMYKDKKRFFSGLNKAFIVTPSMWLGCYVKDSFLSNNKIITIHNGINTQKYTPGNCKHQNDERIILGVANSWAERKGLEDFIKLDKLINHDKYRIILVGLNEKQLKGLPNTIEGIKRTNSEDELIGLYQNAYVFVNPTYQDNYPTTNMEALACGTPVITYNTGGSPESIDKTVGLVIPQGDIEAIANSLDFISMIDRAECRRFAEKTHEKSICFREYIKLYREVLIG